MKNNLTKIGFLERNAVQSDKKFFKVKEINFIESFSDFVEEEDIYSNRLVGSFKEGKYTISQALKEEFVKRNKYLTERGENYLTALLYTKHINLKFQLRFEELDKENYIAKFYILEKCEGGERSTFVADYVEENNIHFRQKAREVFNILLENDSLEPPDFDEIDRRMKLFQKKLDEERMFVVEMYSELFVLRMIDFLKTLGKDGEKILKQFNKEGLRFKQKNLPNLYSSLRKILQKQIVVNNLLENEEVKKLFNEFIKPIREFDTLAGNMENKKKFVAIPKKEQEKEKDKAQPQPAKNNSASSSKEKAKKSVGKTSGGTSPKPKENKKEKKNYNLKGAPKVKADENIKKPALPTTERVKPVSPPVSEKEREEEYFDISGAGNVNTAEKHLNSAGRERV